MQYITTMNLRSLDSISLIFSTFCSASSLVLSTVSVIKRQKEKITFRFKYRRTDMDNDALKCSTILVITLVVYDKCSPVTNMYLLVLKKTLLIISSASVRSVALIFTPHASAEPFSDSIYWYYIELQ